MPRPTVQVHGLQILRRQNRVEVKGIKDRSIKFI